MRPFFALALLLAACGSSDSQSPAPVCATPVVTRGACSAIIRAGTVVQPPRPPGDIAIGITAAGHNPAIVEPGECVYTDACGDDWQVTGCYLGDGYVCPR
jgi:hypothetical protein